MNDGPPPVTDDLYALMTYLHAECNRDLLDSIAREQLSFSQLLLLDRLRGGRRKPTVRQAAAMMRVSPAGASRIIHALARRGMIHREVDGDDLRIKRLAITDRGEEAIRRLHAVRRDHIETFDAQLEAGERDELRSALQRVLKRDEISAHRPVPLPA